MFKRQKIDFDQQTVCGAPVRWSKYITWVSVYFIVQSAHLISQRTLSNSLTPPKLTHVIIRPPVHLIVLTLRSQKFELFYSLKPSVILLCPVHYQRFVLVSKNSNPSPLALRHYECSLNEIFGYYSTNVSMTLKSLIGFQCRWDLENILICFWVHMENLVLNLSYFKINSMH